MPTSSAGPPTSANACGQALVEAVAALRDDLDAGRQPGAGRAVEHEHAPGGAASRSDGVERVASAARGQRRGLARACTAGTAAS